MQIRGEERWLLMERGTGKSTRICLGVKGVLWSIEYGSLEVVSGGLAGRVDGADNRIMDLGCRT